MLVFQRGVLAYLVLAPWVCFWAWELLGSEICNGGRLLFLLVSRNRQTKAGILLAGVRFLNISTIHNKLQMS